MLTLPQKIKQTVEIWLEKDKDYEGTNQRNRDTKTPHSRI